MMFCEESLTNNRIERVNKESEQCSQSPSTQIPPGRGGGRPYPENKQTLQQGKAVTNTPTVAADELIKKTISRYSKPNRPDSVFTQTKRLYNTTQTADKKKL